MFVTPFLIGLAGSLHCIGMCSPLVMAVHGGRNLVYNAGRIFTYSVLGVLMSFIGMGFTFAGIQSVISIIVGVMILIITAFKFHVLMPSFLVKFIIVVRTKFKFNPIALGMVNGLLPCGMTAIALAYCVTLDGPVAGLVAMMSFGLGTLPAMLGLPLITRSFVQKLPNVQTTLMILSGLLLIGRGITTTDHRAETGVVVCGADSQK